MRQSNTRKLGGSQLLLFEEPAKRPAPIPEPAVTDPKRAFLTEPRRREQIGALVLMARQAGVEMPAARIGVVLRRHIKKGRGLIIRAMESTLDGVRDETVEGDPAAWFERLVANGRIPKQARSRGRPNSISDADLDAARRGDF